MARVTYCDICYVPIKLNDKIYVLGILEATETSVQDIANFRDSLGYRDTYGTKLKEVCEGCKKVLERFFHIRKDELEEVKAIIEKITEKRGKNGNKKNKELR